MKNFQKIASAIAALSLAACVAVPMSATVFTASAATKVTVSSTDTEGVTHTYTAYQIFKGTYTKTSGDDGEKEILTDVSWGADVDSAGLLADERFTKLAGNDADINKIMEKLGEIVSKTPNANELAQVIANHLNSSGTELNGTNTVNDGYYIIKDSFTAVDGKEDTYSYHILGVVGGEEITFTTKKGKPSFQKKLKDTNDTDGTTTDWQDSADYDIGDTVPFQLKATLPSDIDKYKTYKMVFHDNLQNTFDTPTLGNVWIDVNKDKICNDGDVTITGLSIVTGSGEWTVTLDDIIKSAGGTALDSEMAVYVEYTAKLKDTAVLGSKGNWNEAWLEYSNNPNYEGEGDTGDKNTTDETPHDKVVVFTYKLDITKVKDTVEGEELNGANFELYKKYETNTDGKTNDVASLKAAGADVKDTETWVKVEKESSVSDPKFQFKGVDDGEYYLVETQTPPGYNSIDPMKFTVNAEHTDQEGDTLPALKSLSGTADDGVITLEAENESDSNNVGLATKVVNKAGAVLPSTGGIGTTLFYLGGGALVAVAGVMLITKKRMTKE